MISRLANPAPNAHLSGFLRLLLVMMLAFDLVSSPFHHHSHDAGMPSSIEELASAGFDEGAIHVEADGHRHFGHSLGLLLPRLPEPAPAVFHLDDIAVSAFSVGQEDVASAHEKPLGAPEPVPIAGDRHLRPANRAPPTLLG